MIRGAMDAGCAGLSIGRNAFQHENPERFVAAMAKIVHGDASVEEAFLSFKRRVRKPLPEGKKRKNSQVFFWDAGGE